MNKKIMIFSMALIASMAASCNAGGSTEVVNPHNIEINKSNFNYDGNFVKPELTIDGVDNEEEWNDPEIQELSFNNCRVKLFRGDNALFAFFKVKDNNLLTIGENNGDQVSESDSVEFYLDTFNDGGTKPQTDDYQLNLGIHNKTRILVGSGSGWSSWNGLCQYEVKLDGTLNDESDVDVGYNVEFMIPYSQININKNSDIGVAFGMVNRSSKLADDGSGTRSYVHEWFGLTYGGIFVEPQTIDNYITFSGKQYFTRGSLLDPIKISGTVKDANGQPVSGANITVTGDDKNLSATTGEDGTYSFENLDPFKSYNYVVSKEGFDTYKYTLQSSILVLNKYDYTFDISLRNATGKDDEIKHEYTTIGSTSLKEKDGKTFPVVTLSVSRKDPMGVMCEIYNATSTTFDKSQQYEVYIDTGNTTRKTRDGKTFEVSFQNGQIKEVIQNPSSKKPYSSGCINLTQKESAIYLFVPYAFLQCDYEDILGFSMGIWDYDCSDWSPISVDGNDITVETPNKYIRIDGNGGYSDGKVYAKTYNISGDTNTYLDLGSFGGNNLSTIKVEVDHSHDDFLYVRYTKTDGVFSDGEVIKAYIDIGNASRIARDTSTYRLDISTNGGYMPSFVNYGDEDEILDTNLIKAFKDDNHFMIKIPYSVIGNKNTRPFGFAFEIANETTSASLATYDVNNPSTYVRISKTNTIN